MNFLLSSSGWRILCGKNEKIIDGFYGLENVKNIKKANRKKEKWKNKTAEEEIDLFKVGKIVFHYASTQ